MGNERSPHFVVLVKVLTVLATHPLAGDGILSTIQGRFQRVRKVFQSFQHALIKPGGPTSDKLSDSKTNRMFFQACTPSNKAIDFTVLIIDKLGTVLRISYSAQLCGLSNY